jgi:hypothetical protein
MEVYLVFSYNSPYCGPHEYHRIFRTKDEAQTWINEQRFPETFYIREEELE